MRFTSGAKTVEVKNGEIKIDGKKVTPEEAEEATGTRFIRGGDEPINLGGDKQHDGPQFQNSGKVRFL